MRSEAKIMNQNMALQEKIYEQAEEIKQLRQYLRDVFEREEDKIVAMSFEKQASTEDESVGFNARGNTQREVFSAAQASSDKNRTRESDPLTPGKRKKIVTSANTGGSTMERGSVL